MQTTCDLAMSTLCALPKFQRAVIVTSVMDDKNTLILGWNLDSSASSTVGRSNQPVESTASRLCTALRSSIKKNVAFCVHAISLSGHGGFCAHQNLGDLQYSAPPSGCLGLAIFELHDQQIMHIVLFIQGYLSGYYS